MTTSDGAPPPELRGPLGQLVSPSGGIVPLLAPAPAPFAVTTASPGLATAAASPPPGAPTVPAHDPAAMLQLLSGLANELFGTSVAPSPSPGAAPTALAGGPTAAASPGLAPNAAVDANPFASPTPFANPGPFPSPTPSPFPNPGPSPSPTSIPGASATPPAWHDPAALFGAGPTGAVAATPPYTEIMRLPVVTQTPLDAPPSFLPDPDALGLESDRRPTAPTTTAPTTPAPHARVHQHDPTPAGLARDLGGGQRGAFDPHAVRRDFPILEERVHGKRLVWLDNGATTQKPNAVIDRLAHFYRHENSNIHRAAHTLAARATDAYETARETTRRFLNAPSASEIIFVRGATEGINLVAQSWGRRYLEAGDEIVVTHLEHHANIVPWQQLCSERGLRLRVAPVDDRGAILLDQYERLLNPRTKLVAFTHVSNALGTITPAREMIALAHRHGARVLLDGAQAVSHMRVDVQALDCDWYVFSGHKVFAPTGIGAVYGKRELLEATPPWQGGGNMIADVTFERTTYQGPPARFEAGTGNIADAVGLGAALDYVMRLGQDNIDRYEHELLGYATARLQTVPGLRLVGTAPDKAGVLSFVLAGQRTEDVGAALDRDGIAVRSGHHCAQPILRRFGLEATVRASLAFYNVCEDIDALVDALHRLQATPSGAGALGR